MEKIDIELQENQQDKNIENNDPFEIKKKIIPDEWKEDIDNILTKDLLGANRYFVQTNPNISKSVELEASKHPRDFYKDLVERWGWHNEFYEKLLEPSIDFLLEAKHTELSPEQIKVIIQVYQTASMVDVSTLQISGAIKKNIDKWINDPIFSQLSEKERNLAITPPQENFWLKYHIDHLQYIKALNLGDKETAKKLKLELLNKYHINDEKIFLGRQKPFSRYDEKSIEKIDKEIESLSISPEQKIEHFYLTMERPTLKSIRDILIYDNVEEYRLLTSLFGISGFILRKKILEYLSESKILPNNGQIYEFDDLTIKSALEKLLEYRCDFFKKNINTYKQTGDTCGAASLMMVLNYLSNFDLNKENEEILNNKSKSQYISGNHFSALANEANKFNLETKLIHSEKNLFKNDRFFDKELFVKLTKEYNDYLNLAKSSGTQVETNVLINSKTIREYLDQNYLILLAGKLGQIFHSIVVCGHNENGIIINDPLRTKQEVYSNEYIENFMSTQIGRWALLIRKDSSSVKLLLDNLNSFRQKSKKYMSVN